MLGGTVVGLALRPLALLSQTALANRPPVPSNIPAISAGTECKSGCYCVSNWRCLPTANCDSDETMVSGSAGDSTDTGLSDDTDQPIGDGDSTGNVCAKIGPKLRLWGLWDKSPAVRASLGLSLDVGSCSGHPISPSARSCLDGVWYSCDTALQLIRVASAPRACDYLSPVCRLLGPPFRPATTGVKFWRPGCGAVRDLRYGDPANLSTRISILSGATRDCAIESYACQSFDRKWRCSGRPCAEFEPQWDSEQHTLDELPKSRHFSSPGNGQGESRRTNRRRPVRNADST